MSPTRLPVGTSDPISYTCTCPASSSSSGGKILLFYRYFASPPSLPTPTPIQITSLADFHSTLTTSLSLGGKIRISSEGFNITLGGTSSSIEAYISACLSHWSFAGLDLSSKEKQDAYFKPSPGCACCFGSECSVRITAEITPMGVTGYAPKDWGTVIYLSPAEFHAKCIGSVSGIESGEGGVKQDEELVLLDVRNHYESRIGYFVSPRTGKKALTPGIRRFAQWPLYVRKRLAAEFNASPESVATSTKEDGSEDAAPLFNEETPKPKEKAILTYCTGGIRCEKGARFLADALSGNDSNSSPATATKPKVYTLHGGIAAYLTWMSSEITLGHMKASDSLFKGQNYVFDARGSVGLSLFTTPALDSGPPQNRDQDQDQDQIQTQIQNQNQDWTGEMQPVSTCHICSLPTSHLSKCSSTGCHLILVICASCLLKTPATIAPPRCCASCEEMDLALALAPGKQREGEKDGEPARHAPRQICDCEREREARLWGDDSFGRVVKQPKQPKAKAGARGKGRKGNSAVEGLSGAVGGIEGLAIDIRVKTID